MFFVPPYIFGAFVGGCHQDAAEGSVLQKGDSCPGSGALQSWANHQPNL